MNFSHQRLLTANASDVGDSYVTEQCDVETESSNYFNACKQSRTTWPYTGEPATLIVLSDGELGRTIVIIASRRIAFDSDRRQVVSLDQTNVPPSLLETWKRGDAAAIMRNSRGEFCAALSRYQAVSEAWLENAFVIACRKSDR